MCGRGKGPKPEPVHCCAPGGRVRGFIQPWLLLLLAQGPAHGYELMDQLGRDENVPLADPALLYRTLRQFEEDGLVSSDWDTGGTGPARRVYQITEKGREYLRAWAENIEHMRVRLKHFMEEYRKYLARGQEGLE